MLSRCWRPLGALGVLSLASAWLAGGCISRADSPFTRVTDRETGGGGGSSIDLDGGTPDASIDLPPSAPHAVLGVNPPHGSFAGGSLAVISGNGFAGTARVWFGEVELDASAIVPIGPQRIQVTVPPGHTGPADVTVQNGSDESTRASLSGGYSYDQFYADPSSGPTSGGTRLVIQGDGTRWNAKTTVLIDQNPCVVDEVISKTELHCTAPAGTPGSKPIRVTTADGVAVDVLDAFVYGNSDNGFKGGLSGNTLGDSLKVIALDNITSLAIKGATVIVGTDLKSADVIKTDSSGVVVDTTPGLGPKRTVTIARKCYQPQTFVDVAVDTLTAYLDPVLSPACGSPKGDLPASGDSSVYAASVTGQVVWPATAEFRRDGWLNVPTPKADEQLVAYVLRLSSSATDRFALPSAIDAITPSSAGDRGYAFNTSGLPGNFTLYALAGIESAGPPRTFTAYQMGLVRGVAAAAGETKSNVYIQIDVDLDHALTLALDPPSVTARGPDRVQAYASIQVGTEGYAPLPNGFLSRSLPLAGPLSFVGVPTLSGSLLGTSYIATARAVTGQAGSTPRSVVGLASATYTSAALQLDPFVQVPVLTNPAPNTTWDGKGLASKRSPGGAPVDLFVYEVQSGSGLVGWTVIAPGTSQSIDLPDLNSLSTDLGLIPGPLSITVNAARIKDFAYSTLRYRDTLIGYLWLITDVYPQIDPFNQHIAGASDPVVPVTGSPLS